MESARAPRASTSVDGRAELRKINLEFNNGAGVAVRSGLKPGDRQILDPPTSIANGMRIQEGIEVQSRSWTTRFVWTWNPSQTATLETEICGQRLWARRAEKSRLNAPNRLLRPGSPHAGYGNAALFLTLGTHVGLRGLPGGGRSPTKPVCEERLSLLTGNNTGILPDSSYAGLAAQRIGWNIRRLGVELRRDQNRVLSRRNREL